MHWTLYSLGHVHGRRSESGKLDDAKRRDCMERYNVDPDWQPGVDSYNVGFSEGYASRGKPIACDPEEIRLI